MSDLLRSTVLTGPKSQIANLKSKISQWFPNTRIVAPEHSRRVGLRCARAMFVGDGCADFAAAFSVGEGCEGAGPGDVAMAGRVMDIAAFGEDPLGPGVRFAKGEVITGDVLLA